MVRCDWVSGRDLQRFMILSRTNNDATITFLVRRLEGAEEARGCDACVRRHSPTNPRCSMNLAEKWRRDPCFYNFRTRQPILGHWRLIDASWRDSSVGVETWERKHVRASTANGAFVELSV